MGILAADRWGSNGGMYLCFGVRMAISLGAVPCFIRVLIWDAIQAYSLGAAVKVWREISPLLPSGALTCARLSLQGAGTAVCLEVGASSPLFETA